MYICKQIHLTTSNIQEQKNMDRNREVQNFEIDWFDQSIIKDSNNKDTEPITNKPDKKKKFMKTKS